MAAIVFERGSTIVLTNGLTSRELLVGSVSVSQTFLEAEKSVKTLHNRNKVSRTFTNSKGPANIEFTCQLTSTDGLLLEWAGMELDSGKYFINPSAELPVDYDLYLKTKQTCYRMTNCSVVSISFDFSKARPLSVTFSSVASDWADIGATPVFSTLTVQNSVDFVSHSLSIEGIPNIAGFTLEITKEILWQNDKSIHDIVSNNIYVPKKAYCTDISVSGSITTYKNSQDSPSYNNNAGSVLFNYGPALLINLDRCKILERWETGEVHKTIKDYKLLPATTNAFIQLF